MSLCHVQRRIEDFEVTGILNTYKASQKKIGARRSLGPE
jgi:hypothetical protein